MPQVLYRKYRSKSLSEIVGQEHITQTLARAIKSGRIAHAYLFTGPKGVGKTSIARILAHEINGLNYQDDQGHIDIIEIDAASNRKLDETKALIEKVYVSPVSAKFKVYIIDEVHMLTTDSFNALLKTLEEPPAHVVFILATTEAHKLPETIISRTQRFQFKPIAQAKVEAHLKAIAQKEKIKVDDAAISLIAAHGQGSFRDSISLLDQASTYADKISTETINNLLGIPPPELVRNLLKALESGQSKSLFLALHGLYELGYPAALLSAKIAQPLRTQLVENKSKLTPKAILDLLADLLETPASPNPEQFLEICLLRALPKQVANSVTAPANPDKIKEPHQPETAKTKAVIVTKPNSLKDEKPITEDRAALNQASWDEVLNLLKKQYNTLYGVVRMGRPDFSEPGTLRLKFAFPFHQKRVNDPKNKTIIERTITQVGAKGVVLECLVDPGLLAQAKADDTNFEAINTIFGGGELLD